MRQKSSRRPGFFGGLAYPLRGARFVFQTHRDLARYWVLPVALTFAALVGVAWAAVQHRADLVDAIWDATGTTTPTWWITSLHWLLGWLLAVLSIGLGALLVLSVGGLVAAPFNDALSAAVERVYGRATSAESSVGAVFAGVGRSIATEFIKLLVYWLLLGPLWLLALLAPHVGGPLLAPVGFAFTVAYLAVDYTDWPASRRDTPLRTRFRWLRQHTAPLAGFGLSTWLLLWLPGINLLLMPAAVAGGTLLYLDLEMDSGG